MVKRALAVSLCLVAGGVLLARSSRSEPVPVRTALSSFPLEVGHWTGERTVRFDQQILNVLGTEDYLNRIYLRADGRAVGFYVGYYESQREGDTMHSPLNCLPGAGWQPVSKELLTLQVGTAAGAASTSGEGPAGAAPALPGKAASGDGVDRPASLRTVTVNRLKIQKGIEKQAVLYWYQSHGRVVASEYWGKIYTVVDAIRLNRTDAAMVRIIAPVVGNEPAAEQAAFDLAEEFARAVFPLLGRYLPE